MNKEIEAQYDKILSCSTVTDLRKIEDDLLMTRMLLINYHNICFNLKQALNEIRKVITECKMLMPHEFDWDEQTDNILQIINEALGDD